MTSDSEPKPAVIFHITDEARLEAGRRDGALMAPSLDAEGFIHASTAEQLLETLAVHFRGVDAVTLLALNAARLGEALVYEASRGGALFPHIYAPIPMAAVIASRRQRSEAGRFLETPALRAWLAAPGSLDAAAGPGAG